MIKLIKNNTFRVYSTCRPKTPIISGMAECVCLSEIIFYRAKVVCIFQSKSFRSMVDVESDIARSGKEGVKKESAGDDAGNEKQCVKLVTVP